MSTLVRQSVLQSWVHSLRIIAVLLRPTVNFATRRPSLSTTLPGQGAAGRKVTVSSTGHAGRRPWIARIPRGPCQLTYVVLPTTSVLSGDHWPAARRPRPQPTPLLGGSQGRRPLWVSSSSVSYMTMSS